MHDIIYLVCYVVSFFAFLKTYKILLNKFAQQSFKQDVNAKIREMISKQEMLYNTTKTTTRISAFDVKNKEKLDELLASHEGVLDYIKMVIRKSGIKMSVTQLFSACIAGGLVLTSVFIDLNVFDDFIAIPLGMGIGAFLIWQLLAFQAEKRKHEFLNMFPDTIDMMVRGVKAGLNVSRIIRLVSIESKDPIASEFNTMLQKIELGVPYDKVFVDAANEIDIQEFRFMSVALILQIENGGMLAEILSNLSNIVRKRLELQLKVRAMSSESRMSAIILCALPFVFAGIMLFTNPSHLQGLIEQDTGVTMVKVGSILYFIGVVCMLKVTKMEV